MLRRQGTAGDVSRAFALAAAIVFLSGFLLFQTQLMTGAFLLPVFGGAPHVWIGVMAAFQLLLAGGYALATWPRWGAIVATLLLIACCVEQAIRTVVYGRPLLPVAQSLPGNHVTLALHTMLFVLLRMGPLVLVWAATSPLIQHAVHRAFPERSPYGLYRASNLGCLAALLVQPLLLDSLLPRTQQTQVWGGLFALYALLCALFAAQVRRFLRPPMGEAGHPQRSITGSAGWSWLLLAALSCWLMMSVSQRLTDRLPAVPLLWACPLALYLLSFVVAFHGRASGWRGAAGRGPLLCLAVALLLFVAKEKLLREHTWTPLWTEGAVLFAGCLGLHRAIFLARPPANALRWFYIMLALGGATGGLWVALAAPVLFDDYAEYPLAFLGLAGCLGTLVVRWKTSVFRWVGVGAAALAAGTVIWVWASAPVGDVLCRQRSFFGVLTVLQGQLFSPEGQETTHLLKQGTIVHGFQAQGIRRYRPTTYYTWSSGVGRALLGLRASAPRLPRHIGLVGLGVGTLACYGRSNDVYRFYEIDPAVIRLATDTNLFTYLHDSGARIEVASGDARKSMAREVAAGDAAPFDLIVLDAFLDRSPPVHLLTVEAVRLYLRRLEPNGVLAFHASNPFLDLTSVVRSTTGACGLFSVACVDRKPAGGLAVTSHWVLASPSRETLAACFPSEQITVPSADPPAGLCWTDEFTPLLRVLR